MASVIRRIELYRSVVGLIFNVPGRWPKLLQLVHDHRMIFVRWSTIAPGALALLLLTTQLIASRLIWPEAGRPADGLTIARVLEYWPSLLAIVPLGLCMVAIDLYGIIFVGQVDRAMLEGYFDQAEYWLKSRTSHVVKFFTFGFVNPHKMVSVEVEKALAEASNMLTQTFWWIVAQMSFRVAFGLSLWLTWAVTYHF